MPEMTDKEEAKKLFDVWLNDSGFDKKAYDFSLQYKTANIRNMARSFYAALNIRAEAVKEERERALDRAWSWFVVWSTSQKGNAWEQLKSAILSDDKGAHDSD